MLGEKWRINISQLKDGSDPLFSKDNSYIFSLVFKSNGKEDYIEFSFRQQFEFSVRNYLFNLGTGWRKVDNCGTYEKKHNNVPSSGIDYQMSDILGSKERLLYMEIIEYVGINPRNIIIKSFRKNNMSWYMHLSVPLEEIPLLREKLGMKI